MYLYVNTKGGFILFKKYEKLLSEKGITSYQVSKDKGIPTATLSDWKNGRSVPKLDKLIKIANYFDVTLEEFIKEDD